MLNKAMEEALNNQIAMEFSSSYIYLSMAAHFEHENLPGFANWMRIQSEEERLHAMKIFNFINDRGGRVVLQTLPQPPTEYGAPLEIFQKALAHEEKVSASINNLYGLAMREGDYAAQVMLGWFVNEQVEEEKNATAVVEQLKRIGDDGPALIMLDREMGARTAEPAGGEEGGGE